MVKDTCLITLFKHLTTQLLAFGIHRHLSSTRGKHRPHKHTNKHIQINKSSTPNMIKQLIKILLTCRSCFYDRVSAKTAKNGDRTEKIWTPEDLSGGGAFHVFHLKTR